MMMMMMKEILINNMYACFCERVLFLFVPFVVLDRYGGGINISSRRGIYTIRKIQIHQTRLFSMILPARHFENTRTGYGEIGSFYK